MSNQDKWYYSVPGVLVLLFFVLGPLALPLLYKSPKFNQATKIILTSLVLAATLLVFNLLISSLRQVYVEMKQLEFMLK
ncbi:hypothetical protein COT42_05175 [Candidatus Saganbacteria bacterium CG08_land_8_20_14_0_20_45_16]|uniref:Uncharacterized protein n=1 Tax=Candidatus Saganbacteria bacterium CG08_land_8_20_14_0_20_45_16 TaxID=2014293 RepID=A0A2H0XX22_UNCSA|nr:MAG: hypothetical protein COT42_05175 [Candidatus Saganbacteria bacterium CG08_land_8_20_14_0_20_45_16]